MMISNWFVQTDKLLACQAQDLTTLFNPLFQKKRINIERQALENKKTRKEILKKFNAFSFSI